MSTLEQAKQDYFVLSSSIFKSIIKLLKSSLVLDVGKATLTAVGKLKSFFGSIFGKTVNYPGLGRQSSRGRCVQL